MTSYLARHDCLYVVKLVAVYGQREVLHTMHHIESKWPSMEVDGGGRGVRAEVEREAGDERHFPSPLHFPSLSSLLSLSLSPCSFIACCMHFNHVNDDVFCLREIEERKSKIEHSKSDYCCINGG